MSVTPFRDRVAAAETRTGVIVRPRAEVISAERRDPQAAGQALTYSSPGMRQIPNWDSESAIQEAYLSSVIVYACVRTRAYAFAGCPLRAVMPGKPLEEHDPSAPLAQLLGPAPGGPNPNLASRGLWRNAIANRIVTGKIAWELEKPQGARGTEWAPVGIWPLTARAFFPLPSDDGTRLFDGFMYGRSDRARRLTPEQVFYSYIPSLSDMRQAESPLQPARYDITGDVLQSIYDVAFLRNDGRPAGVIVHERFEEEAAERAWKQQWDAEYRGPWNANRMAFTEVKDGGSGKGTEGAISFVQLGLSQKDAQALITHQDKARRICIDLSVPMSLLDASGRTFNNAGMEERSFWMDTMLPDLADMEDEINLKLAPRLGPHVARFDTRHVAALEQPVKYTSISLGEAVDRKLVAPQEARQALGFPEEMPEELADTGAGLLERAQTVQALVAAGYDQDTAADIAGILPPDKEVSLPASVEVALITAGWDEATAKLIAGGPSNDLALDQPATDPAQADIGAASTEALSLARSVLEVRSLALRRGQRRAAWRAANAQAIGFESVWRKAMRRLFEKQRASTMKRIKDRSGRWAKSLETRDDTTGDDWSGEVFDQSFWQQETEQVVAGLFEAVYAASGSRVSGHLGQAFDINSPKVQAAIDYRSSKLAEQVTGTTYDAIRSVILNGLQTGASIPDIATGIEAVFAAADGSRAELIARTETIAASNDGALAAYDQAVDGGLLDATLVGKEWIATDDERTDEDCVALDGEVVAFDDNFSTGDDAPPLHPDCRCAIGVADLDSSDRSINPDSAAIVLRAIAAGHIHSNDLEHTAA